MVIENPAPEQLPQLRQLWRLAFGDPEEFLDAFFAAAYAPERCRCILEKGQIVAVLYWFDVSWEERKFAYLYAVATHPDFRGRGLCRALMEDTHALLARHGYDSALLVPQKEGLRKMYASFGYRDWGGAAEFTCGAGERAVPIRAVSQGEYAGLRREFLPKGGVVQEGENLDFLSTYAVYYAGQDFLLAMAEEDGKLLGIELLGNAGAAPGIVKALGCESGTFRTPGNTRPFAMGISFGENQKMPTYFGLAFD